MATLVTLETTKTFATRENAAKAVEKKYPDANNHLLRYIIVRTDDGRFYPVFVNRDATQLGVHFHFHVVG